MNKRQPDTNIYCLYLNQISESVPRSRSFLLVIAILASAEWYCKGLQYPGKHSAIFLCVIRAHVFILPALWILQQNHLHFIYRMFIWKNKEREKISKICKRITEGFGRGQRSNEPCLKMLNVCIFLYFSLSLLSAVLWVPNTTCVCIVENTAYIRELSSASRLYSRLEAFHHDDCAFTDDGLRWGAPELTSCS